MFHNTNTDMDAALIEHDSNSHDKLAFVNPSAFPACLITPNVMKPHS